MVERFANYCIPIRSDLFIICATEPIHAFGLIRLLLGIELSKLVHYGRSFWFGSFNFCWLWSKNGRLFSELSPLRAYSINVFGGLIGTLIFSALCFMNTPPGVWLAVAGVLFCFIDRKPASFALIILGIVYSAWLGPYITRSVNGPDCVATHWSPYYRIDVLRYHVPEGILKSEVLGYNVYINYDSFQSALDCSPANLSHYPKAIQDVMLRTLATPFEILLSRDRVF